MVSDYGWISSSQKAFSFIVSGPSPGYILDLQKDESISKVNGVRLLLVGWCSLKSLFSDQVQATAWIYNEVEKFLE